MSIAGGIVVFGVMWWLVLFVVLPFGIISQHETTDDAAEGTDPGAPVAPRLVRKLLITTAITLLLWGVLYTAMAEQWVTLENIPGFDPREPRDS